VANPRELLDFWLNEVGPDGWYVESEALDAKIQERFGEVWQQAAAGECGDWVLKADTALALVILLDQFPRNMFRGSNRAFSTDRRALCVAKKAVGQKLDLLIDEPQRHFFYMPLMHSESLTDQERCVRLMATRMPATGAQNLVHARVHREVIRKFGRFPYRNGALSRSPTAQEAEFLANGGYVRTLEQVQEGA